MLMDKLAGTGRKPDGVKLCKVNDYNICLLLHAFMSVMALDPNHLLLNYHVSFFKSVVSHNHRVKQLEIPWFCRRRVSQTLVLQRVTAHVKSINTSLVTCQRVSSPLEYSPRLVSEAPVTKKRDLNFVNISQYINIFVVGFAMY